MVSLKTAHTISFGGFHLAFRKPVDRPTDNFRRIGRGI
ncbi:Uncharacterised protein [Vibrio cholerae]|nr:Uncharacterised protein [Vibrio cholerae]